MVYVKSIDTEPGCRDCTGIRYICLNNGEKISREEAYNRVKRGAIIYSGSESGPKLLAEERGSTKYVRTAPNDTPNDNLLSLPRTC